MGFDEILTLVKANAAAAVFVIGATVALIALAMSLKGRKASHLLTFSSPSEDETRFRNVFGLMTSERREALISYYMQKHKCGRREAMRIAVDDRASDETRW